MGFYINMIGVLFSIWVFVCSSVLPFMGFIGRYIFRLQRIEKKNDNDIVSSQQEDQIDKLLLGSDADEFREKEVYFDFENDKIHEESKEENRNSDSVDTALDTSTNKYEFISGEYINGFIEEPKVTSFIVQELYLGSLGSRDSAFCGDEILDTRIFSDPDFLGKSLESHIDPGETEDPVESIDIPKLLEKQNQEMVVERELSEIEDESDETSTFWDFLEVQEIEPLGEPEPSDMANDPEVISLVEVDSLVDSKKYADNYTSLSDAKSESICNVSSRGDQDTESITNELLEKQSFSAMYEEKVEKEKDFLLKYERKFSIDEFIELEPSTHNSSAMAPYVFSEEDSGEVMDMYESEETIHDSSEETGLQGKMNFSYQEDGNDLDFFWDDDDIIEQIKLELKNARTGGLPTIVEEVDDDEEEEEELESPMIVDDLKLKPLKIEMKFDYKHRMQEIQKVHKTYAEKMRKLDVLNNQTMHAIGFLQLKEKMKSISSQQKSSLLSVKSLWSRKTQNPRINSEPMLKDVGNLYKDLEFVYVGQVCLSWEILHWQHLKVQELQEYEAGDFEFHEYNLFASKFQLFQVLLQRFIEDESYKGPRVQNYAKNRCVLPTLLQVPALRDDSMRDSKLEMKRKEGSISIEKLSNFMTESLFTFWKFIRKDERSMGLKGARHTVIFEPADSKLLSDIRKEYLKKDKRLRDIQRTGNCLVKKFQKPQGNRLEQELLVPEVELRMISRVLNMSALTRDQLIWCHQKLKQIRFDNKKVHLEPSFSLFPC